MAVQRSLLALKASQLKHVATCLGLATTGPKADLESVILRSIAENTKLKKAPRIVSVDMGIKNLGVCVLEAPNLAGTQTQSHTSVKVLAWKKVDVLSQMTSSPVTTAVSGSERKLTANTPIDASIFRPSSLSKAALSIAQDLLDTYKPTHILIERQRFRSGSASAVQEWTLRVNLLESMLYACFETMRSNLPDASGAQKTFPETVEVNPARVGRFWCGGVSESEGTDVEPALSGPHFNSSNLPKKQTAKLDKKEKLAKKDKIDKGAKIAVVRSWLDLDRAEDLPPPDVQLDFSDEAQQVAETFSQTAIKMTKSERKAAGAAEVKGPVKLDDLADCLLQGVAWVRWEENRRKLAALLETPEHEKDGEL